MWQIHDEQVDEVEDEGKPNNDHSKQFETSCLHYDSHRQGEHCFEEKAASDVGELTTNRWNMTVKDFEVPLEIAYGNPLRTISKNDLLRKGEKSNSYLS